MYLYCINFVPWVSQFVHLQSCPKKPESQYPPLWPRAIQEVTQANSPRLHLENPSPLKIITMRTEQSSSKTPGLTSWLSPRLVGPGQCWWTPTAPTSTRGSRFWGTFREFFRLNWNKLAWEFENLPDWGITLLEVWKMLMFSENWLTDWRTSVSTLPSLLFLSSNNWFHQLDLT